MDSHRAERFAEGLATPEEMSPEERAIEVLVKKSVRAPARLEPADLVPLVGLLGTSGALEVVAMPGAFHFVTRVADLVAIESELPIVQRRWRWLRSLGVRLQSRVFRRVMDLANEAVEVDVRMLLAETERIRGASLPSGYAAMHASPNVAAWAYRMTVELPSLDGAMLGRVTRGVAAALPASEDESTGFHARPPEPLDALRARDHVSAQAGCTDPGRRDPRGQALPHRRLSRRGRGPRARAPRADRAPVRPRADGPAVGQPRDAVPRSGRKPGQRLPPDPSLGLLRGYSSAPNRVSSRFKNSPTSVTIPVDSTDPRSASFVTTAGLMST